MDKDLILIKTPKFYLLKSSNRQGFVQGPIMMVTVGSVIHYFDFDLKGSYAAVGRIKLLPSPTTLVSYITTSVELLSLNIYPTSKIVDWVEDVVVGMDLIDSVAIPIDLFVELMTYGISKLLCSKLLCGSGSIDVLEKVRQDTIQLGSIPDYVLFADLDYNG